MGYEIKRSYLEQMNLDNKLNLSELPVKLVPGKPYDIFGKTGAIYKLFAGQTSIDIKDLRTLAVLSAQIERDILSFELITRPSALEERYNEDFDAKLFVGAALQYLKKMGNRIAAWEAVWNGGDNFTAYRHHLKHSVQPPEFAWSEAVWNTWTGKQALSHGFGRVEAKSRKDIDAPKYVFHFKQS